ncbi:AraC family transcriptional regulator [Poritiphilus flavus]|uniref:AraC family transcriptional regulator n=1 Tax=Poritiphilus flavus TaxID=2697053 RepID=A0A6L9EDD4_9FLAO|nr:AraC family transcriptional regulator [Poritiphilus flavus]NAS12740.1 AraC family transcriptional regulator [Poritiphilus flavus]
MKKIWVLLGILLLCGLIWYLFLKPFDYQVTFRANTYPGIVNQSIKSWSSEQKQSEIVAQDQLLNITQQLQFGDSVHIYHWQITPENDSLSRIKVNIEDPENGLANRLRIPFSDTDFEKRSRKTLTRFNELLKQHLREIRVKIVEPEMSPETFCACTKRETSAKGKALGMMKDFPLLNTLLAQNEIKLNGSPILEITSWDRQKDSIAFNFCFPVVRSDSLPEHPELFYRTVEGKKSLKAIYNGNYITSDRAWYALLNHAENENQKVTGLPLEVFKNNPNMGGDALRWEAEVYMPLSTSDEEAL